MHGEARFGAPSGLKAGVLNQQGNRIKIFDQKVCCAGDVSSVLTVAARVA